MRGLALGLLFIAVSAQAKTFFADVHGETTISSQDYFQNLDPTNQYLGLLRVSLTDNYEVAPKLKLKLAALSQTDPVNNSSSEKIWIDAPNDYLQFQEQDWLFKLGFQTFNWGVTDGYNPVDVVSAQRLQDPLNVDKLGAFSVSLKKNWGNFTLEGLYIPFQRETVLPGNNSRWLPRQVYTTTSIGDGTRTATLLLPSNLQYTYADSVERDHALSNNAGLRASLSNLIDGLDVTAEAFDGAAQTPGVDLSLRGTIISINPNIIEANRSISLIPVYFREQSYGGTMVYANFGMIFRFETDVTRLISKGTDLPGHSEHYVFELERPFSIGSRDLTLIAEFMRSLHQDPPSDATTSADRIFDRAVILGMRFPFSESFTLTANALFDFQASGRLFQVQSTYRLSDDWKLIGGVDIISGSPNSILGTYANNDRVVISGKYSF